MTSTATTSSRRTGIPHHHHLKKLLLLLCLVFGYYRGSFLNRYYNTTQSFLFSSTRNISARHLHTTAKKGGMVKIFQPYIDMPNISKQQPPLIANAHVYVDYLKERLDWLDTMTYDAAEMAISAAESNPELFALLLNGGQATTQNVEAIADLKKTRPKKDNLEKARLIYLELIQSHVSALVFGSQEKTVQAKLGADKFLITEMNHAARASGLDWTYLGDTMVGSARLQNIRTLLQDVIQHNIPGDYIETGVWRGGASMFARAVLYAYDQQSTRKSFVCDSFAGLPPGDRSLDVGDQGWDHTKYLEVNDEIVAQGFQKYSLLDENVIFAKGFFNDTMPALTEKVDTLAIMRLDGDLYESTVDVLYHMYDKLSIGGYVIMDDWFNFPSQRACEDFFLVHNIWPKVVAVDQVSAYWQKTEQVEIQYWRYQQGKFQMES